jgi:enamine deaminase RidA (YjgF/YER057c/UK114 family)
VSEVRIFAAGGYRFINAVFQYSGGVAAEPGHRIVRVRLARALPLAEGLRLAEDTIRSVGRPITAFCACELRSPAPFTEKGFREFNEVYAAKLKAWAIYDGKVNPVARSNVCPALNPPNEPSLYAFAYTEAACADKPTFIVAGSGEAPEGKPNYRDFIVRRGDVTPAGLREKARFVLDTLESRLAALGLAWADTTATQVYTVQDLHPFLADEIVSRGAASAGLTWHYCRPPVVELEYEMDCRGVGLEWTLST